MNEVSEAEALIKTNIHYQCRPPILFIYFFFECSLAETRYSVSYQFCSHISYTENRAENREIKGQVSMCHLQGQTPASANKRAVGCAVYLYCCTLREPH